MRTSPPFATRLSPAQKAWASVGSGSGSRFTGSGGGCFQTSLPTTHEAPTYTVAGVVHYCVANMPSAVPCTATQALNNVTLPFGLAIADKGYERALAEDPHLLRGLNVCKGRVTNGPVARHLGYDCVEPTTALAA